MWFRPRFFCGCRRLCLWRGAGRPRWAPGARGLFPVGMDGWRGWCPGGQVDGERGRGGGLRGGIAHSTQGPGRGVGGGGGGGGGPGGGGGGGGRPRRGGIAHSTQGPGRGYGHCKFLWGQVQVAALQGRGGAVRWGSWPPRAMCGARRGVGCVRVCGARTVECVCGGGGRQAGVVGVGMYDRQGGGGGGARVRIGQSCQERCLSTRARLTQLIESSFSVSLRWAPGRSHPGTPGKQ